MLCGHPAMGTLGCLHVAIKSVRWGSDILVTRVIAGPQTTCNNAKQLESCLFCNSFTFNDVVGSADSQILVLFIPSAGPLHGDPLDPLALPNAERHR